MNYARAYVTFSRREGPRLEFIHNIVRNCGRDWEYVALDFAVSDPCDAVQGAGLLAGEPYVRPRTLRRRIRVAERARGVVARLGWTLTGEEEQLLARMASDRTRQGEQGAGTPAPA